MGETHCAELLAGSENRLYISSSLQEVLQSLVCYSEVQLQFWEISSVPCSLLM